MDMNYEIVKVQGRGDPGFQGESYGGGRGLAGGRSHGTGFGPVGRVHRSL